MWWNGKEVFHKKLICQFREILRIFLVQFFFCPKKFLKSQLLYCEGCRRKKPVKSLVFYQTSFLLDALLLNQKLSFWCAHTKINENILPFNHLMVYTEVVMFWLWIKRNNKWKVPWMEERVIIVDGMLLLYQLEAAFNILLAATSELYFLPNGVFYINCLFVLPSKLYALDSRASKEGKYSINRQ